jgi:hypothetical protein
VVIALIVTPEGLPPSGVNRLRLFLRLGRWLRWTLFKDNLSFTGNVRVGDLLAKLQIELDIGDSLFQGFAFPTGLGARGVAMPSAAHPYPPEN